MPNQIQSRSRRDLQDYTAAEREAITARFWAKVKKSDGCWLWIGSLDQSGYGQIGTHRHGKFVILKAHRLAWELAYGPIPLSFQINHHCDVRNCTRPEHLYLGTQQQNLADARLRRRLNEFTPRTKKLTLADRLAIYHMPNRRGVVVALALHYGVTKTCITLTRQGRFAGSPVKPVRQSPRRLRALAQRQEELDSPMAAVFERVPHVNLPVRGEVA